MCYDFKFEFVTCLKVCKFNGFPRIFQIINYLFFKEVDNPNNVKLLSCKFEEIQKIDFGLKITITLLR